MSILAIAKYTNLKARKSALEKTSFSNEHLMMSSVLKLAKSTVMATRR